jgi:hypothetical protein
MLVALVRLPWGIANAFVRLTYDTGIAAQLQATLRSATPDIIIVTEPWLLAYAQTLRTCRATIVLDLHNIEQPLHSHVRTTATRNTTTDTTKLTTNSNDKISIGFKNTPLTETTLGSAIGQKSRIDFPTPLRLFANEDPFLEFYYPLQGTTPGTGGLTLSNGTPVVNVTVNSITTKSGVTTKDLPITNTYVYKR